MLKAKQKKSTKISLSDRISDALTVKPRADIEDDQVFGTKPQTVTSVDFSNSESEDEALISDFRKRNVNLLSEISKKYEGQIVSKKDLEQDFESGNDESGSENDMLSPQKPDNDENYSTDSDNPLCRKTATKTTDSEDFDSDRSESEDYSITKLSNQSDSEQDEELVDDDGDEGEGYDISQMEEPPKEDFEHIKKQDVTEEVKKGNCVRNQLLIWEGLLEMRIHLQRCMSTTNQMPMSDTFEELKKQNKFLEECNATKANVANVLDKFLTLQNLLFKNYPETKGLFTKKQTVKQKQEVENESDEEIPSDTDNEEIPSDTDDEHKEDDEKPMKAMKIDKTNSAHKKRKLEDYETEIETSHKAFKAFRDTTIQKWNDKTRLATAVNIKDTPTNTILQQISYILSDKNKLLRRTQLKRSEYEIVGYKKENKEKDVNGKENPVIKDRKDDDEYISEIFDDSDFYHQLLRELIECKSADISDPVQLSRQWIVLQQMRSKMKRRVDTKATKGRKIKYVVHNKLINFMAQEKCRTWTDESTNELYSSLFGKMFEQNNVGFNGNVENDFKIKE